MQIDERRLLGFANKANRKNDAMVGTKGYKPRRRRFRRWRWC